MSTKITKTYEEERAGYFKILAGLLILTVITFIQPTMFFENITFSVQILIGTIKAWLILMFYMHLKGEKLIITFTYFSLFIVLTFFVIVIGFDVDNFQFSDQSYIVVGDSATETIETTSQIHGAAHAEPAHH